MTSLASSWLPDHQLAVAATLSHADESIGQVSDLPFPHQTRVDGIVEHDRELLVRASPVATHGPTPARGSLK